MDDSLDRADADARFLGGLISRNPSHFEAVLVDRQLNVYGPDPAGGARLRGLMLVLTSPAMKTRSGHAAIWVILDLARRRSNMPSRHDEMEPLKRRRVHWQ